MSLSKFEYGPLRPDLLDLSDSEESEGDSDDEDAMVKDDYIRYELTNSLVGNVCTEEEERNIFENCVSIAEGM
jgi:hypothetical protein